MTRPWTELTLETPPDYVICYTLSSYEKTLPVKDG